MNKNRGGLHIQDILIIFICIAILVFLFLTAGGFFAEVRSFFAGGGMDFRRAGGIINIILSVFAIFFLAVMAYSAVRLLEIREREKEWLAKEIKAYAKREEVRQMARQEKAQKAKNPKWVRILDYLESQNPADWKLAVIEADNLLLDLLSQLGFKGEGIGEKLKSTTQENFPPLPQAWEAHAVRNNVAHQSDFPLSGREAKRVIALYEGVFRHFDYI